MASNGATEAFSMETVLAAMTTMRSGENEEKKVAMEYLNTFQKSRDAWTATFTILQSSTEAEAMLFAATTLKGKITYDLTTQIPESDHPALRNQILLLLKKFAPGPRPIRVQLCVCLAVLAIQMTSWKDVLPTVVSVLGNEVSSHAAILDFLRILPEEVTEGRKITLSEDELTQRTTELLADNKDQVVQLLIGYAHSSAAAAHNPQLFECITSWLREVPVGDIVVSPLLDVIFNGLVNDDCLEAAAECLGSMCRETREVDEYVEVIRVLLPRILALRPRIQKVVEEEDAEAFKALTRLFADAGDSWVVLIVREPIHFQPLVEAILECFARDKERDVMGFTFEFWYELKQYLVLDRYIEARVQMVDVYGKLVDVLFKHLEFPQSETGNELDLFDGDREQEEKFREFRHKMGDTLKDACAVMGTTECLNKVLAAIKVWTQKYGSLVKEITVPHWQELEAPIFAMRAMGRMVENDENIVLPQLIPLLCQMPSHEKLRFATVMVFGRYTEWTAEHPEFLQPQFKYITASFQTGYKDVIRAAAQAIKFFCTDCRKLLSDQVVQMQTFYEQILDSLPVPSQEEMTEGVASVVGVQKSDEIYKLLKLYCDPLVDRLMKQANQATDEPGKYAMADTIGLLTFFVQHVIPSVEPGQEDPAVKYWLEVFPILATVMDNFSVFGPICERICRCWRSMVISYRSGMTPLLPLMANKLAEGFATYKQGAFLWVTGAILREFSEDREYVEEAISDNIYTFFETQTTTVLRVMSDIPLNELPDLIEDFFRLLIDALLYYPQKLIQSPIFTPIFQAAVSALVLEQRDPLSAALHYLRDLLMYGAPHAQMGVAEVPQQCREIVIHLLTTQGETLVKQILAGMMITFPRDCFADGSAVLLAMFDLLPSQTTTWVERTIKMLPSGTVTAVEADRLMVKIKEKLQDPDVAGGLRQVRALLQDFTNTYRRRYVAPRDGLGALEGKRFHFEG